MSAAQQVVLEIFEGLAHRHALLLALHEGSELGGNLNVAAENLIHRLLELRWMGSLKEHTRLAWLQTCLEGAEAAGTVRITDITSSSVHVLHRSGNLRVGIGGAADVLTDGGMAFAIQVIHSSFGS